MSLLGISCTCNESCVVHMLMGIGPIATTISSGAGLGVKHSCVTLHATLFQCSAVPRQIGGSIVTLIHENATSAPFFEEQIPS